MKTMITKISKKAAAFGVFTALLLSLAITAFASPSYSEWYYEQFQTWPDGTVYDWENDPVYWSYLEQYDQEELNRLRSHEHPDPGPNVEIIDAYWSGTTARWCTDGVVKKYQVRLYREGSLVSSKDSVSSTSVNFSSAINQSGNYWFEVRPYSKYGYFWGDWVGSEEKYFSGSTPSPVNPSPVNPFGPSTNTGRWVGSGDSWQIINASGTGYITNSWWQDPATKDWYLIGCTNVPGRESYMSAGLFRDAAGNWYLLNPLHDGTFGKMVTGDAAGNYILNYNGQSIPIVFNKNHDGFYGRIISDVTPVRNVLGGSFDVTFVPPTAP